MWRENLYLTTTRLTPDHTLYTMEFARQTEADNLNTNYSIIQEINDVTSHLNHQKLFFNVLPEGKTINEKK
jgi:hypothetical protein